MKSRSTRAKGQLRKSDSIKISAQNMQKTLPSVGITVVVVPRVVECRVSRIAWWLRVQILSE